MEGVGARLGRSSTRYGPTTVFNGPVRKWKKKWIHVTPPNSAASSSSNHHSNGNSTNGNGGSHLLLYKWTPISQSHNNGNGSGTISNGDAKDEDDVVATEEPPRRKFKYIPIAVLEEQKAEDADPIDDEVQTIDTDTDAAEPTSKTDYLDEKPDINDVPMEENQASEDDTPQPRQDLNESTLDLSLGFAHDGDNESDLKVDQTKDGQLDKS